ncbi:hypothetical protein OSB04_010517 [Centaurea solstitialis]|uniref:DNA-directed DNA polymerase family A palm domain-containing protein n=1 Tax=Centaurea solstitialis TaxID=347529 RepID=A0AA38TFB5_9ASTR|nr:hypothetical protein OSB04_010517 [Centaurea solstitialis]
MKTILLIRTLPTARGPSDRPDQVRRNLTSEIESSSRNETIEIVSSDQGHVHKSQWEKRNVQCNELEAFNVTLPLLDCVWRITRKLVGLRGIKFCDKKCGGLGVGSLRALNIAMLCKWWWRERVEGNSKWRMVVSNCNNLSHSAGNSRRNQGGVWTRICGIDKELADVGININSLFQQKEGGNGWRWVLESNEIFTVRSIRRLIDNSTLPVTDSETEWIKTVPGKANILLWHALSNRLPTKDNLTKRGVGTVTRVLVLQYTGRECRSCFHTMLDYENRYCPSFALAGMVAMIAVAFFWIIWTQRNNKVFDGSLKKESEIFRDIQFLAFEWFRCRSKIGKSITWESWICNPENAKPHGDVFNLITAKWTGKSESSVDPKELDQTKRLVYGILYGMGANSLAEQLECSPDDAGDKIQSFKRSFPGLASWLKEAVAIKFEGSMRKECHDDENDLILSYKVHSNRCLYDDKVQKNPTNYVETLMGRKRFLAKINFGNSEVKSKAQRQAVNSICQLHFDCESRKQMRPVPVETPLWVIGTTPAKEWYGIGMDKNDMII